jgi:hypothetical protein
MCTVLLSPGFNPTAVNKYIILYQLWFAKDVKNLLYAFLHGKRVGENCFQPNKLSASAMIILLYAGLWTYKTGMFCNGVTSIQNFMKIGQIVYKTKRTKRRHRDVSIGQIVYKTKRAKRRHCNVSYLHASENQAKNQNIVLKLCNSEYRYYTDMNIEF